MDWYKYGNTITSELSREIGYSYPKVKGQKRDDWIKGAFAKLKEKSLNEIRLKNYKSEVPGRSEHRIAIDDILNTLSLKEINSKIGKYQRVMDKDFVNYLEFKKLYNKSIALDKFEKSGYKVDDDGAFDKYQILLGETEARAVQARRGDTIVEPSYLNNFKTTDNFEKTNFPPDQFEKGKMNRPPSYFNLKLDDLVT